MSHIYARKLINILLCLALLGLYIKAGRQEKKLMRDRQVMEKKAIDRRLDSLINNTVIELKITNDTIKAKNEQWRQIDKAIKHRSKSKTL